MSRTRIRSFCLGLILYCVYPSMSMLFADNVCTTASITECSGVSYVEECCGPSDGGAITCKLYGQQDAVQQCSVCNPSGNYSEQICPGCAVAVSCCTDGYGINTCPTNGLEQCSEYCSNPD